jgi:tetratricopeptide (TPR) repeat protein
MIVNLARGKGLYELHGLRDSKNPSTAAKEEPQPSPMKALSEFLIWPARLAAWGGILYVSFLILTQFFALQGPVDRLTMGGEVLQWWLAWAVMLACVAGLGWVFLKLTALSENPAVSLVVILALKPLYICWGYFEADIYHNVAIFYSKQTDWDHALQNYGIVHKLDPNFVMSLYFTGNVFNDRFNMDKTYNPMWGDKDSIPRDDYDRALEAYDEVRRLAPDYVQSHFQVGMLHFKRAQWEFSHGHPQEAQKYLDRAMTRFRLYRQIDPVFEPTYYQMGQILMLEKHYADAAKVFADNIRADKCSVAPSLLGRPDFRTTILAYQDYNLHVTYAQAEMLQMRDVPPRPPSVSPDAIIPYPVHLHESAPAYTNLANAYIMMRDIPKARAAYQLALNLDPNFAPAKRNLEMMNVKGGIPPANIGVPPGISAPAVSPNGQ